VADAATLETEARVFGRYLVGRVPPPAIVDRYRRANETLLSAPVAPADAALLDFVHRHPWSVSFLDAASGLLRPANTLRSKLLVMSAILEASPEFADDFLPESIHPVGLVLRLAVSGTAAVLRAILGAALLGVAVRARA